MKKKTFYQTNIFWQLFCFVFLTIFILIFIVTVQCIIAIIKNGFGKTISNIMASVFILAVLVIGCSLALIEFIILEHNNVHLTKDKIYMNNDWNPKKDKIQYYTEAYFADIESIDIIWTKMDSRGKLIRSKLISASVEKPYLPIKTKDGKISNFFVMYIPKKNVIKIINEISYRMKSVGNNSEIINSDEAYLKIKKKIYIDI